MESGLERPLDCSGHWHNLPIMKASRNKLRAEEWKKGASIPPGAPPCRLRPHAEMDVSLLEDSLAKTPWERMQANDDASRFADSLREAMEKRHAKSERTDTPTG